MGALVFAAAAGLVAAGCLAASAAPAGLLDADNPAIGSHWKPPASPTAGLKVFAPVEPKDWRTLNQDVAPASSRGGTSGMDMSGKGNMPGMGSKPSARTAPTGEGAMGAMPGMKMDGMKMDGAAPRGSAR